MIIDLPVSYMTDLAHAWDSGMDFPHGIDLSFYQELTKRLEKDHRPPEAESRFRVSYIQKFSKGFANLTPLIDHPILIEGFSEKERGRSFFFQQHYLYKNGEQPMIDFVLYRETGQAIIGVPDGVNGDHDGQYSENLGFQKHEYLHALLQRIMDQRLFDRFGIETIADATLLKELDHRMVLEFLDEWSALSDARLKAAVEGLMFAYLHEQGLSYPIQVASEIESPDRLPNLPERFVNLVNAGELGRRLQEILRGINTAEVSGAIDWIQIRARKDTQRVQREFRLGL